MKRTRLIIVVVMVLLVGTSTVRAQFSGPDDLDRVYLDDRSGPDQLLESYVNAINRHEYVRAYSYWEAGAAGSQLAPYPDFERGYAQTARLDLILGETRGDTGAGQIYYAAPVALQATEKDGSVRLFVGCYTMHLSRPSIQGVPPFRPLSIRTADVWEVPADADLAEALATACPTY